MRGKSKLAVRLATVGVAIGMVGLPLVGATTANAAVTPSITVTPAVGLSDGSVVTVAGTGYDVDAGTTVYVLECSGSAGQTDCNTGGLVPVTVAGDGTFSTTITVHTGAIGTGGHSCTIGGTNCLIAASDALQAARSQASISFGPYVSVTPHTALTDGQSVTVTGGGYAATEQLYAVECSGTSGAADCNTGSPTPVTSAADGTFTTPFTVHTGTIGSGTCSSAAANCFIAVGNAAQTENGAAAIAFAPTGAQITVTPNANLKNNQVVKVSGAGFPAASNGQTAYIVECSKYPPSSTGAECNTVKLGMATVHSGSFAAVNFTITTGSTFTSSGAKGTCGYGHTCYITATTDISGSDPTQAAHAAVTFAHVAPPTSVKTATTAKASVKSVKKGKKFTISGTVKAGKTGVKGLKESLYAGKKKVASTTSKAGGKFSFKLKGAKKTTKYHVSTAAKTIGSKAYKASTSKVITVKHKK